MFNMMNDILEQVTEDYYRAQGYFTQHNVKYRPSVPGNKHTVHSDIDVIALNPLRDVTDPARVIVASCKSWQGGLNITTTLKNLKNNPKRIVNGRESWKSYREIASEVWASALRIEVKKLTGADRFTFLLAVTKFKGDRDAWQGFGVFGANLQGCEIKLLSMEEMLLPLQEALTVTPEHSELGRMLQLIKAGGGEVIYRKKSGRDSS